MVRLKEELFDREQLVLMFGDRSVADLSLLANVATELLRKRLLRDEQKSEPEMLAACGA